MRMILWKTPVKVYSNLNHLANNTHAAADNNFIAKSSLHLDSLSVPLKSFQIKSIEIPESNFLLSWEVFKIDTVLRSNILELF